MRRLLLVPALLAAGLAACSAPENVPNQPALDSPSGAVFACVGSHRDTLTSDPVPVVLPPHACSFDLDRFIDAGPPDASPPDAGPMVIPPGRWTPDAGVPDAAPPPDATPPDAGPPDARPDAGPPPPWEEPIQFALISELARGDVMVARVNARVLVDADPLSPGLNGLPVGQLPIGIALVADGCYAVTANAGSCDLAAVNVLAATTRKPDAVTRLTVSSATEILAARPAAIVGPPSDPPPAQYVLCPEDPSGHVYVAYPDCRMVARVSLETGRVLDAVQFLDGQAPAIVPPDAVACAAECTDVPPTGRDAGPPEVIDAAVTDASTTDAPTPADASTDPDATPPGPLPGMPDPAALAIEPDGSRLYIGAFNSPALTVVDLDQDGAFVGLSSVTLEGAVGVLRIAASGPELMGDDADPTNNIGEVTAGTFHFVYAIGRDGAIHVVDVTPGRAPRECDAQVDRRYLADETDEAKLACMPVGDPTTPPRRVTADGPGIRLPLGRVPLDVVFLRGDANLEGAIENPSVFNGLFALVSTLGPSPFPPRGQAHYINVDDQNYPDLEDPDDPRRVHMQLAVPHTLRDRTDQRRADPKGCDTLPQRAIEPDPNGQSVPLGSPRIDLRETGSDQVAFPAAFAYNWQNLREVNVRDLDDVDGDNNKREVTKVIPARFAPSIHIEQCDADDWMWELQSNIPTVLDANGELVEDDARALELAIQREDLFPDLGTFVNERFVVAWEGPLEPDGFLARRPGGDVSPTGPHSAILPGGSLKLEDSGGTLCDLGVEKGDVVRLMGCTFDSECGPSQICAFDPLAPAGSNGMCLPEADSAVLLGRCTELLSSVRRYTVERPFADVLELRLRPVVMAGSPIEGCIDVAQCDMIYAGMDADAALVEAPPLPEQTFACEPDPFGGMGPLPRCIATCTTSEQCIDGSVCEPNTGRCVLGPLPLPECVAALQTYDVRAGDAFTIVGDVTGYHHRVVAAPDGSCVVDETKSPLLVSRFHRDEPTCAGPGAELVSPNPCVVDWLQEPVFVEEDPDPTDEFGVFPECDELDPRCGRVVIRHRPARIVRIRTPGLTVDIADVAIPIPSFYVEWDGRAVDPGVGADRWYSPIPSNYSFAFPTAGGFVPQLPAPLSAHLPKYLVTAPDGVVWVIDAGEGIGLNGVTRGQLVGLTAGETYSFIF